MNVKKVAVLDLGTNTFNLLLVKVTPSAYYIFRNEKIAVKIGQGGINQRIITEDARQRALDALYEYKTIIAQENVNNIYCFATSAFRNAENAKDFAEEIMEKTGFILQIIDGDTEAGYIYKGVKTAFDIGGDNALIMDIGGGSVEFIICNRDKVFWKQSFDIGAQRLLDWFHKIDPIPKKEVKNIYNFFKNNLTDLVTQVDKYKPYCLIGSSGTFDTLSDIYQHDINRFSKGDEKEQPLSVSGFLKIYNQIILLDKKERLKIPGMIEMRVDMIVVAACLVKYVIDTANINQIRVSAHALKEGLIYDIQQQIGGNTQGLISQK